MLRVLQSKKESAGVLVHLHTSELHVPYTPSSRFVNRNQCFCLPTRPAPRGGTKSRAEAPHAACAAIKKGSAGVLCIVLAGLGRWLVINREGLDV